MTAAGRLDIFRTWAPGFRAMMALDKAVSGGTLEHSLLELVRLRCSQHNGCDFCVDLHRRGASAQGVSAEQLEELARWPCSDRFDARARAGLALADALAHPGSGLPDALLAHAREVFTPAELCQLFYAIATIHAWNRLAIADETPLPSG